MPLYEYQCRKCGHQFEELLTASEADTRRIACPACRSKQVEREFSAFATGGARPATESGGGGCGSGGFT